MPTRKDYLEHFPQYPWAKGHVAVTFSSYPHAAPSDLENELLHEQRQQHAVSSTYHQAEGRAAGSFLNVHDELQDEESAQLEELLHGDGNWLSSARRFHRQAQRRFERTTRQTKQEEGGRGVC